MSFCASQRDLSNDLVAQDFATDFQRLSPLDSWFLDWERLTIFNHQEASKISAPDEFICSTNPQQTLQLPLALLIF